MAYDTCYVEPTGFKNKKDFEFWMNLCLDFNDRAKSSMPGWMKQ